MWQARAQPASGANLRRLAERPASAKGLARQLPRPAAQSCSWSPWHALAVRARLAMPARAAAAGALGDGGEEAIGVAFARKRHHGNGKGARASAHFNLVARAQG